VVANPAGIAQIRNLDGDDVGVDFFFDRLGRAFVERNSRYLSLEKIAIVMLAG
jgi:hypothetical protein